MESTEPTFPSSYPLETAQAWWAGLSAPWKQAYNEVAFKRSTTEYLGDEMLMAIYSSPNHRFAGPTAPYPNMSFELEDLSGVVGLPEAVVLVVSFHQLKSMKEVASMKKLRSIFLFNNQITSLEGIEDLTEVIELYVMSNQITSLEPLHKLVHLKALYCNNNLISDLKGIGPEHADNLENFFCLPNPNLKNNTVFAFEQANGIRCRKA
jgi:Leucine-rich repeat (LRR) protein